MEQEYETVDESIENIDEQPEAQELPEGCQEIIVECYGVDYPVKVNEEFKGFCNKCYNRGHKGLFHNTKFDMQYPQLCKCVSKYIFITDNTKQELSKIDLDEFI